MVDPTGDYSFSRLARQNAELAQKYADLAAKALQRDEERKKEIDSLRAEIVLLHEAIADLKETIRDLRAQNRHDAEQSGSFKAQEIINQRELAQLQEREKERRKLVLTVLGSVLSAVLIIVITALATVAIRDAAHTTHASESVGK
jgi:hypothetical protein